MKSNEVLQNDVPYAVKWEQPLNAAELGLTAKDGVRRFIGIADSFHKKSEAGDAAKKEVSRLVGVKGVPNNIKAEIVEDNEKIVKRLALDRNSETHGGYITVTTEGHNVTLHGFVPARCRKVKVKTKTCNASGVWIVHNELILDCS